MMKSEDQVGLYIHKLEKEQHIEKCTTLYTWNFHHGEKRDQIMIFWALEILLKIFLHKDFSRSVFRTLSTIYDEIF